MPANERQISIYLIGLDSYEAISSQVYPDVDTARNLADDTPGMLVFEVTAYLDLDTIVEVAV